MLEQLICAVFGHRYIVERVLNPGARKVGCTRCEKHWGMHDGTRSFVPWDGELEALYEMAELTPDTLRSFAELVAAAEREECAALCDRFQARDVGMQPAECAAAILARGKKGQS